MKLIGCLVMIAQFGIAGAALSTAVAHAITHQAYIYLVNHKVGLKPVNGRYALNLATLIPITTIILCRVELSSFSLIAAYLVQLSCTLYVTRSFGLFDQSFVRLLDRSGLPSGISRRAERFCRWLNT